MRLYEAVGKVIGSSTNKVFNDWVNVYKGDEFRANAYAMERMVDRLYRKVIPDMTLETLDPELQSLYDTAMLYELQIFEQFGVNGDNQVKFRGFQPSIFTREKLAGSSSGE